MGVENLAIRPLVVYFMEPMQTKVVKLDAANVDSAKIKEAASLVDDGGLVAFPTETVYGIACQAKTDSLARLNDIKGRDRTKYYTLHIGQKNNVKKYVPTIGLRAEKLIRNAWPGPLTIVFELDHTDIDKQKKNLERKFFKSLYTNNSIGIRCPDNPIATMLLQATNNPVIAPSANIAGQPPAVDAEQAPGVLGCDPRRLLNRNSLDVRQTAGHLGHVGRFVALAPVRHRRQVGAVGLDEQPV